MRRQNVLSLILAALLITSGVQQAQADSAKSEARTQTPIKHFIVMMQENHTFDNYFGTYPGAEGFPPGTRMPIDPNNPSAGYVEPWHLGNTTISDLSHNGATFTEQFNGGKMNGFVAALNRRNQDGRVAMGYYDGSDIPYYWNVADNYVLLDHFFSSAKDGSFSNHMYWVAGAPPPAIGRSAGISISKEIANLPTIFDRLQAAKISWKFYVQNYDPNINYRNLDVAGNRSSQVVWVPLLYYDRFLDDPELSSRIVDLNQYFKDLREGTLPAVAYIIPSGASEHPPQYPATGMRFVKNLIQELMRSQYWESSAFLLLYDDWGGWYDHVMPPAVDEYGYGPRVPALLVSSYARKGYVDQTVLDFTSCLKFIEYNWGVEALAARDSHANNFLSAFDFEQPPRKAVFLPLTRDTIVPSANKKVSISVIYTVYGLALLLSVAIISSAFLMVRWTKREVVRGEAGNE